MLIYKYQPLAIIFNYNLKNIFVGYCSKPEKWFFMHKTIFIVCTIFEIISACKNYSNSNQDIKKLRDF